jgi:hypothetical protein
MTGERSGSPRWYRNAGRAYHAAAADWVSTGLAVCGANIGRAGYVWSRDSVPPSACRRCHAKVAPAPAPAQKPGVTEITELPAPDPVQ